MPGIVGLITKKSRTWAEPQLQCMLEAMQHESFYETGTLMDECLGVYAGWTAQKNSFADEMPVRNERGDIALIFSGEEFPDPAAVRSLRGHGHDVNAEGASYLVHTYEDDPNFPASLNGRFQGLVADCSRRTVALFTDRYGMHKLYYHESEDAFYFSAEAKAILRVRPELRSMDVRGLAELLLWQCVREDRTMFTGIHTMPPASKWVFQHDVHPKKCTYFNPREWEEQPRLEPETYSQQLRDTFSQILPRYLTGNERIGVSLTGGLDSRMIMAWQRQPPGGLPCYTFGGMYRTCRDVALARRVANICQQPHEVIPLGHEFLSRFAHYAERSVFLTDGCVDVRVTPDLYVQEIARQIAPVRVSGAYGSEVLRGPAIFKPAKLLPDLFDPEFLAHMEHAKTSRKPAHPISAVVFNQNSMRGLDTLEQTQIAVRFPFLDNDLVRLAFQAPQMLETSQAFSDNEACNRVIADGNGALGRLRTDRGLAGQPGWRAGLIQGMHEFTFRAEYAYDYGMPQWLARIDHYLSPLRLERLFLGRHKFYHFRVWYRDALSAYVRDMLLDPRTLSRPYLQRKAVEAAVRGHLKGDRNYTVEIHKLLTLELIHRVFVDQRCN